MVRLPVGVRVPTSLLVALVQTMDAAAAAAAAAADADATEADAEGGSDILFTVTQAARSVAATSTVSSLGQQVVAPSSVASAGGMSRQINSNTWHVPQHVPLQAFLYVTGPPDGRDGRARGRTGRRHRSLRTERRHGRVHAAPAFTARVPVTPTPLFGRRPGSA